MPTPLSGSGVGLPAPQALYPSSLGSTPYTSPTNILSLYPGEVIVVPAGHWFVSPGNYGMLQYVDPVTGLWRSFRNGLDKIHYVWSDGFNLRLANLTGCPVGAVVTAAGSNYVQATTTVTANGGNSTWVPIVGGLVSTTTGVTAGGSGYGTAPLVHLAAPPYPGVQATAHATISSGTVSSVVIDNQGAGYTVAPAVTFQTNPNDPNFIAGSAITTATATLGLTGAGTLAAVLCTDPGVSGTITPTLTVSGAGTSATASAVMLWTITGGTIANAGAGYNAASMISSVNGANTITETYTNPEFELKTFIPRQAQIGITLNGTSVGSIGTIVDAGLFMSVPQAIVLAGGASPTTVASISGFTVGGTNTYVMIQPAP